MKVKFKTTFDSVYVLDYEKQTWQQLEAGRDRDGSQDLRSVMGAFHNSPEVVIGQRVSLICPPYVPNTSFRFISTSEVAEILEVHP